MNFFAHGLSVLPIRILLFILLGFASITHGSDLEKPTYAENTVPGQKILVMGDSISAGFGLDKQKGWVNLLSQQLGKGYRITNASISGETTTGGRNRLAKALQQYEPDLVILELGGNDGLRGTPIKHIQANLTAMIQQSQATGAQVLVLGMRIPPNYGERYTGQFSAIYKRLAAEHETLLVPFFMQGIAGETGMMQEDGIHPTHKAQPLMMNLVKQELTAWFASLH